MTLMWRQCYAQIYIEFKNNHINFFYEISVNDL